MLLLDLQVSTEVEGLKEVTQYYFLKLQTTPAQNHDPACGCPPGLALNLHIQASTLPFLTSCSRLCRAMLISVRRASFSVSMSATFLAS